VAQSQHQASDALVSTDPGPSGIGGWLITPIILLVIMIVAGVFQLSAFPALAEIARTLPQWKLYLISTTVLLSVMVAIVCPIVLLVMLFRKMRGFPKRFVQWAVAYIVFMVVNHFMVLAVVSDLFGGDWSIRLTPEALRSLAIAIVPVAVFIPYILKSRRVQNTFVN